MLTDPCSSFVWLHALTAVSDVVGVIVGMHCAEQVAADKDSWARSGWLLVSLGDELWLQEIAPPRRQLGQVSAVLLYKVYTTTYL